LDSKPDLRLVEYLLGEVVRPRGFLQYIAWQSILLPTYCNNCCNAKIYSNRRLTQLTISKNVKMAIQLGCIADDFTGATDLANNLVRSGMKTVQVIDTPDSDLVIQSDAVVIALKSRTNPVNEAIAESLNALAWLKRQGATQIYFKYCSTFDSTRDGNIGPVTEALMTALGTDFTIATPAFPDNKRTVFKGYLFVGDVLLNESGMQNHPLTPMTDANLVRVMQAQCKRKVGLIDHTVVAKGAQAVTEKINGLKAEGIQIAIVDATSNQDLINMGAAFKALPLLTAGSGVAIGLANNFGLSANPQASALPASEGRKAIISGSCSIATNAQVAHFIAQGGAAMAINPLSLSEPEQVIAKTLDWAKKQFAQSEKPVLIYSTGEPSAVKEVQAKLGVANAGALVENTLATICQSLMSIGVKQLIVAGGETSGACVKALGVQVLRIGSQIDPGVPWCYTDTNIHLALKSGNFGTEDFFTKSFTVTL
jgi:3-dehydrotetronate 4-kinase